MRENQMHRGKSAAWLAEYRAGRQFEREFGSRAEQRDARQQAEREGRYVEPRSWMARAGDEVAAWFGVHDALKRRQWDAAVGDHTDEGPQEQVTPDEAIRAVIRNRLTQEPRLYASAVAVAVNAGVVELTGEVRVNADRGLAEEIATAAPGVVRVVNQLVVA